MSETRSLEKHISAWSEQGAEAADEFVRRNRDRVYGICMSILGRREVAEDAAQEALLKAWRHRWDLEDEGREASWIAVIAARQALIELKKWPKLAGLHEGMNSRSDLESRAVVGELFEQLKPEHRVVLALSVHHGMTIHEIAEVLDIPPGTVGSRIHAAREQFKKLWSGAS